MKNTFRTLLSKAARSPLPCSHSATAPQRHSATAPQRHSAKIFNRLRYAVFLIFMNICFFTTKGQGPFNPSVIPNKHFPKPVATEAIPSYIPSGFPPGLNGYTFYNERNGGSCYNQTFDFDGDGDEDNVYVWAINHRDVIDYDNALAYEVTEPGTGNILYRGCKYFGSDVVNLNVGIIRENMQNKLIVAYCLADPGGPELRVRKYEMTTPSGTPGLESGLIFERDDLLYKGSPSSPVKVFHIGLDCSDFTDVVIVWDGYLSPIRMCGYNAISSSFGPVHILGGSVTAKLPDVALSQDPGTGNVTAHIVCVDTLSASRALLKYSVDAGSLGSSSPIISLEDVAPVPIPVSTHWDEFQLKIDAPDHQSSPAQNWAYTYFDNDNNKIKVRVCNQGKSPVYNTYVVNDGSMPTSSGMPLSDLTAAGNAFPSIAYNPEGKGMYVAWFTTYDPTIPGPINNAMYHFTPQSQGYISVFMDDMGTIRTSAYNRLDDNYSNNRIGQGINPIDHQTNGYYPKTCFSKHNEGEKLFTLFSSHNYLTDLIWNYGFGSAFVEEYGEDYKWPTFTRPLPKPIPPPPYTSNINYSSYSSCLYSNTSAFLVQKQVDWYPSLPLFRRVQDSSLTISTVQEVKVAPNPFTNTFKLLGDEQELYQVQLTDVLGRTLFAKQAKLATINSLLVAATIPLASGTYLLSVKDTEAKMYNFKLIKL